MLPDAPIQIRWRALLVPIYGPTVLISIGTGTIVPLVALSARDLGASLPMASFVVALTGIGHLVGDIPAGALAERFGEKRTLLGACVVDAGAMVLAWSTHALPVFAVAIAVQGLASAVFGLARHAYLAEVVEPHVRARALSTLGGTFRIGMFIGPFVGAALVQTLGLSYGYLFAAVMSLSGGLLSLTLPEIHRARRADEPAQPTMRSVLYDNRHVLVTLGFGVLLLSAARATRQSIIPLWAQSQGLDAATVSLIYGFSAGLDMLLVYPGGAVMDRFGRVWVVVPAMIVLGAGFALLPLTHTAVAVGLVAALMGLGNGISSGIVLTLGADVAPRATRRQFLGGWRLCADIGTVTGPGLISIITLALPLAVASVALGAVSWFGAGWLTRWVPAYAHLSRRR